VDHRGETKRERLSVEVIKQLKNRIVAHPVVVRICRKRILLPAVLLLFLTLFWFSLPTPLFDEPVSTVLLDRNGELLGASIAEDEQWRFPPTAAVPEKFVRAITCYEDRRFFYHPGVDPLALARAVWQNLRSGEVVSGGSTITMQVIRLSRKGQQRTLWEKLIEMILAIRLEISMSKEEILALFASHAPFGGNVVGLEAASWRYFGRGPDKLSWSEIAMLAILPNSPSLIHPGKNRERLLLKRDKLLDRLREEGFIDPLSCDLAKQEPLPPKPHPIPMQAPHLLMRVKLSKLPSRSDGNKKQGPFTNPSRIRTTLEKNIQVRAAQIIQRHHEHLAENGIHNAAALIIEVENGNVLAYIGNIHEFSSAEHGNHVDVITAPRSTGSILKPLLYAGMLNAGDILPTELVPDIPTRMGGFAPQNYSRTYQGAVPAHMALARSLNVPAVRMLHAYGVDRFYGLLNRLGMTTLHRPAQDYGLSLILGGAEGTLWDITGIYAGMARSVNNFTSPQQSKKTSFSPPNYLWQQRTDTHTKRVSRGDAGMKTPRQEPLEPAACWLALKAMVEVVRPAEESNWRNFASSRTIAWKTGTSYGFRDGWAIGVTPQYAVGVWVGNANGEGRAGLTGIATAAPILFELFGLLDVHGWFDPPEADLVEIEVCAKSGYRAGPYCAETKKVLAPAAGLRKQRCPYCQIVHCDANREWRVHSQCEHIAAIRGVKWFVLPPAMEWYYKRHHSDYHPLPPYRSDCMEAMDGFVTASMSLIYPAENGLIYVPIELDGQRGRTVFEAAHRNTHATIYWHLDGEYLGATRDIHQIALAPKPGEHTITLVDENGECLQRKFAVLAKEQAAGSTVGGSNAHDVTPRSY
jgi:penicillin-binding protein 1C